MKNVPIGQLLIENKLISQDQLNHALEIQQNSTGKMLGDIIVELGYITEEQFMRILATRLQVPFVDLATTPISTEAVKKIPEDMARKHLLLGISINNGKLTIATNDPVNFFVFEEVKAISGLDYFPVLATKTAIQGAIDKVYSASNLDTIVRDVNSEYIIGDDIGSSEEDSLSGERIENAPVVKLVNTILESAYRSRASDIHIEPFRDKTKIRVRVDGDLIEQMEVSPAIHSSLITRLKILGGMNIAEKRVPQDGRFGFIIDQKQLDVRVSSIPTVNGEKIVIRLLNASDNRIRQLTELGMTDYNYQMFEKILRSPHGIILVTGPTGSGKTTTLYAALSQLAKPKVNIITVEDPVEKQIDGINQVQVNTKAGLTFAASLRSILRQDPDIIMIGEIRDGETAEIAIRAAITGHLVLSTLHTNDAASTIVRLVDMGVAPYLVASSLIGVVAQRLVKLLCPECKQPHLTDTADMLLLGITQPVTIYEPQGCSKCNNTGYRSRTAIHEIILSTNDIKQMIANNATAEDISLKAQQNGTRLLRDNVSKMVLSGTTTMEELIRATYSV
jgi:type IV pilus assembly protein PilB